MSDAQQHFVTALSDVRNLLEFHEAQGGNLPGRRSLRLQSLNKSGIVLLCAAWETYVERVVQECAGRSIALANQPADMLRSIQKLVSQHIREGRDEGAWRSVAGEGWKDLSRTVVQRQTAALNTPKTGPTEELFKRVLGVTDIRRNWAWHKNPLGTPAQNLDTFVSLRGGIAHGEQQAETVKKSKVTSAVDLTSRLVTKIEERLVSEGLLA